VAGARHLIFGGVGQGACGGLEGKTPPLAEATFTLVGDLGQDGTSVFWVDLSLAEGGPQG
jgi:hypothetical protein